MRERLIYFIVVWFLTSNGEMYGQKNPQNFPKKLNNGQEILKNALRNLMHGDLSSVQPKDAIRFPVYKEVSIVIMDCFTPKRITRFIPVIYAGPAELGWFCKNELQLDRITPLPVRFRLGSLNYVNWMEQKPNATKF